MIDHEIPGIKSSLSKYLLGVNELTRNFVETRKYHRSLSTDKKVVNSSFHKINLNNIIQVFLTEAMQFIWQFKYFYFVKYINNLKCEHFVQFAKSRNKTLFFDVFQSCSAAAKLNLPFRSWCP